MNFDRQVFNDQAQQPTTSLQYNKKVLKEMIIKTPFSSATMIIILVMFFLCQITDLSNKNYHLSVIQTDTLIKYGANVNLLVNQGQIYRLLTAIFLHAGFIHLAANSISFFLYLMPIQRKTPTKYLYLAVLLLGGIMGNMLSTDVYNLRTKILIGVGSSTSICSVVGFDFAYRILRVNNQPLQNRRLLITLSYIFLISIMPGVDFFGHFGSLVAGFLIGSIFLKPSQQYWKQQQIKFIKIGGLVLFGIYFIGLIYFIIKYQKL